MNIFPVLLIPNFLNYLNYNFCSCFDDFLKYEMETRAFYYFLLDTDTLRVGVCT